MLKQLSIVLPGFLAKDSTDTAHTKPKVKLVINHQRIADMSKHGAFGGFI